MVQVMHRIICSRKGRVLPVEKFLDEILEEAQDPKLLSQMWKGWAPHV